MSKKVLAIDDDLDILEALKMLLDVGGYDTTVVSDATKALTLAQTLQPNLIILDVLLSGIDGREICRQLKANKATHDIPVIMVSAHPTAAQSYQSYGASDFIEKPFDINHLLHRVSVIARP